MVLLLHYRISSDLTMCALHLLGALPAAGPSKHLCRLLVKVITKTTEQAAPKRKVVVCKDDIAQDVRGKPGPSTGWIIVCRSVLRSSQQVEVLHFLN